MYIEVLSIVYIQLYLYSFPPFLTGDAMMTRGGAIRLILPNGTERLLGDKHATEAETAVVRVRRAALFLKVMIIDIHIYTCMYMNIYT